MGAILPTQAFLLSVTPGLLPLAALAFSALNSWHCSLMCGGYAVGVGEKRTKTLLAIRAVSYALMGALMGYAGKLLQHALEFQLLNVLAFIVFLAVTLFCVLPNLIPGLAKFAVSLGVARSSRDRMGSTFSGLLFAATPCHLLTFYYGLAATTGSVIMGAMLLLGHAVMTSPALAYAPRMAFRLGRVSPIVRNSLRIIILAIVILNVFYFTGRLLFTEDEVRQHIMFCL